jgi:hypothetical protein
LKRVQARVVAQRSKFVNAHVYVLSIISNTAANPNTAAASVGTICLVNYENGHRESLEECGPSTDSPAATLLWHLDPI